MFFCNLFISHYCISPIFEKRLSFKERRIIFTGKKFFTTLLFPILKVNFSSAEIAKRHFLLTKTFFKQITVLADYLLIFNIGYSTVLWNVSRKKLILIYQNSTI